MRRVYLLALFVLVVLFLAGCTDLVQYDKGYHEFDDASAMLSAEEVETHDATLTHGEEETDMVNIKTGDENFAENTHE